MNGVRRTSAAVHRSESAARRDGVVGASRAWQTCHRLAVKGSCDVRLFRRVSPVTGLLAGRIRGAERAGRRLLDRELLTEGVMRVARLWAVAVVATLGVGCGGDDGDDGVGPNPVFTSVSITPASPTVFVGVSEQLTAVAKDQNGANLSGATFTYTSSDQTKATVTNAGLVTGVAAGTARITATGTVGTVTKTGFVDVTVTSASATASVSATASNAFNPQTVAVTRTGSVTWNFAALHNVTFASTAGAPANIPDKATGTEARQFNTTGTYSYQCTIHPGMQGTVVVVQ